MKSIAYTLTHLVPEILTVFIHLALGMPSGLTALQIVSIDLLTEEGRVDPFASCHLIP